MARKVLLDAHTHTIASGHAYSSLQEMVQAAADKGVQYLGITEHGPSVEGTCPILYFKNMFVVPREMYGVRVMMGCEVNILDTEGHLDLNEGDCGHSYQMLEGRNERGEYASRAESDAPSEDSYHQPSGGRYGGTRF